MSAELDSLIDRLCNCKASAVIQMYNKKEGKSEMTLYDSNTKQTRACISLNHAYGIAIIHKHIYICNIFVKVIVLKYSVFRSDEKQKYFQFT